MAQDKTDNEHYVPKTYLRSFSDKNEHCQVFDKCNIKYFSSSVDNILAERYLYDFDMDLFGENINVDKQAVEKTLGRTVDDFWKNIVDNITDNYEWFTLKYSYHYLDVYKCMAIQLIRTPRGKRILSDIYSELYKKESDVKFENILLAREIFNILDENLKSPLLEMLLNDYGHISIGINNTEIPFITSDNPVITVPDLWEEQKHEMMMYYPITPNRCLFFHSRKKVDPQLNQVLEEVKKGKFIISNMYDIPQEVHRREKKINEELNPKTRQVTMDKVLILNTCMNKTATRFIVSNVSIRDNELWIKE